MAHFCPEVRNKVKKGNRRSPVEASLFLVYCVLMGYLLFVRNRSVVDGTSYWEQVTNNYNLTLFHTIGNYWDVLTRPEYYAEKWGAVSIYLYHARFAAVNILGNVAMFVPLGIFLPSLWPKLQRAWKALPVALLTIFLVEICQLFTLRGRLDVDDFLLNMIGAACGYALWWLAHLWRHRKNR